MVVKPKVNLCELIITVRPMMVLPLISIFKIPYSVIVVTLFCMFIAWRGIRARGNAWGVGRVDRNTLSQKRVVLAAFLDETWYRKWQEHQDILNSASVDRVSFNCDREFSRQIPIEEAPAGFLYEPQQLNEAVSSLCRRDIFD